MVPCLPVLNDTHFRREVAVNNVTLSVSRGKRSAKPGTESG